MSESENKDLLEALNSVKTVEVGDVVKGEILAFDDQKQVIVGIEGTGVEGVVPARELTSGVDEGAYKVGDELDLVVISKIGSDKEGGSFLLSQRRLAARKVWDDIEKKFEAGETIKAPVTQVVKGGLVVDAGVRGFIPASMVSDHFVEDLNQYKGQELELKIVELEPSENRLILSHKEIVQQEREANKKAVLDKLVVGDVVEGKVARLTNFGAFIDLGGADGLLHISEMSWGRIENPKKVFKVGDKVTALIKDINGEKIALSMKFPETNPWADAAEKYAVGNVVTGKVARMTDFGAFVELEPGVDALLHVSQISREHVAKPADVLSIGQEITAKIVDFNEADRKISLSMKALEADNAQEQTEE